MSRRPDEPLIRHLAITHGRDCALLWQENPYVLLPGEGFGRYIWEHEDALCAVMPTVEHQPWRDVTFDYEDARNVFVRQALTGTARHPITANRGRCWIRICDLPAYLSRPGASPWLRGPTDLLARFRPQAEEWLAIEAWEANALRPDTSSGFPAYPDVSLVRRDTPWDVRTQAHLYPNPDCRSGRAYGAGFCHVRLCQFDALDPRSLVCNGSHMLMTLGVTLALLTLAYLEQAAEHLVEVRPVLSADQERQEARALRKRPELRRDLPHYILLDPLHAHEYGQARTERESRPGQIRGSPRPHGRRGHWRRLRSPRYSPEKRNRPTWVRAAWIGPEEWVSEGSRYRVRAPQD